LSRLATLFGKHLVPVLRRRPWQRLSSTIVAYDQELQGRSILDNGLAKGLDTIRDTLSKARIALANGDIDHGWKCVLAAQRLELLHLEQRELDAAAAAMRNEAEKLNGWRKVSVIELLKYEDGDELTRGRLFRAALLRDEHYHNEAYKDGLRRSGALRLAIVLIAVLSALLWLGYVGDLPNATSTATVGVLLFKDMLGAAVVGLLGATISAITDMPKSQDSSSRIPEMASTVRITILRLLMGPSSALVLYFVVRSNFYSAIFQFAAPNGPALLVISFVAGFSERLVLRVVETVAGKPSSGAGGPSSGTGG
jgi:hypothetical protein